jgi:hypothetical protein
LAFLALSIVRSEGLLTEESYRNLTGTASSFFLVLNIASLALLVAYVALLGKVERGPAGDGGWLKFYVVIHLYVAPFAVVAAGIYLLPLLLRIAGTYAGFASFLGAQYAALLAVTAFGAYAALRLQRIDAAGLRLTRAYLWVLLAIPFAGVALATLVEAPDSVRFEFHEMQLLDLMKALILFLAWMSYFRISRRVRNTFAPATAAEAAGS